MALTADDVAKYLTWDPSDQRHVLKLLEGIWPARELLGVLEELQKRGLYPQLRAACNQMDVPNNRPRLSVAVAAVESKGKTPPLDFLNIFFVHELAALPADERDAIRAYVSQRVTKRYSLSPAGAEFIFGMEAFRPYMYEDQAGHCTIGYGFLVHKGRIDGRPEEAPFAHGITEATARAQAMGRVHGFEDHLNQKAKVELTQYQADALISFIYNAGGLHELEGPVNEAKYEAIPDLLLRTRVGEGKASLLTRRRAEAALFARGDYSWRTTKDKG